MCTIGDAFARYTLIPTRAQSNKHRDEDPVPNARYTYIYRNYIATGNS